jgi:hypothetical protein
MFLTELPRSHTNPTIQSPRSAYTAIQGRGKKRSANTIQTGVSHALPGFLAPLVLLFGEDSSCLRDSVGTHGRRRSGGIPTFTRDLPRMIRDLVRRDGRGTLNVTNEGSCSWFEFAREILHQAIRDSI